MLIATIILFIVLAIANLVVGVSNDAVNFLHSAIGSGAARKRTIYRVASAGMLLGVFFSQSMVDISARGVVLPDVFDIKDLMAVFVAVTIVNIVLIDFCNTYAIPTSTTSAMVVGLTGGALAIAFIKSGHQAMAASSFINTNKVFLLVGGIFISVILAFIVGLITQFFSRMVFTFYHHKRSSLLLALAGAGAVTVIFFFIIKKVITTDMIPWEYGVMFLEHHLLETIGVVFALTFSCFLIANSLFNIDIPRIVVIFGTFALAMSFAAKDLINFIGIPLTGIKTALNGPITSASDDFTNTWYLAFFILSGIIMSLTLFFTGKTQAVIDTELFLERQSAGDERFRSSEMSRRVVRMFLQLFNRFKPNASSKFGAFISHRFRQPLPAENVTAPSFHYFDTIRASVNLVIATVLILIATWYQIPSSTTFVVFMTAMGTSLADRAWNRENAVYRVSGMFTILGVWLLASLAIFMLSGLLTIIIWYGNAIAVIGMIILATYLIALSNRQFNKRRQREMLTQNDLRRETEINFDWMANTGSELIKKQLLETSKIYFLAIQGLVEEDLVKLREAGDKATLLVAQCKNGRETLFANISKLNDNMLESGHHFIQAYDYLTELVHSLQKLTLPVREHAENNHKGLDALQQDELLHLQEETTTFFNYLIHLEKDFRFSNIHDMVHRQQIILPLIDDLQKKQLKRLKSDDSKTRVIMLYLEILAETKNMLLFSINLIKSHRDFFNASRLR